MFYCKLEERRENESERDREGKHLCRSPCLLSCAQCSGPTAPTFPPHFLPTAVSLSLVRARARSFSSFLMLAVLLSRYRAGGNPWQGWNDWLPVLRGLNFRGAGGEDSARRQGGESRRKKGGSPSPGEIWFYSKHAQCHSSFLFSLVSRLPSTLTLDAC